MQIPRLFQPRPTIHHEYFELDELHPAIADDELIHRRQRRRPTQQPRLVHAGTGASGVERIEHHTGRTAFGEGELLLVDKASLHREGNQHTKYRAHHHPGEHVPPRDDFAGDEHVGCEAGSERQHHIASRRRNGLGAVIFQYGVVGCQAYAVQQLEHGKGENHRGQAHTDANTGFTGNVECGSGEDTAQKKAGKP